jgi:hypothetical protein
MNMCKNEHDAFLFFFLGPFGPPTFLFKNEHKTGTYPSATPTGKLELK